MTIYFLVFISLVTALGFLLGCSWQHPAFGGSIGFSFGCGMYVGWFLADSAIKKVYEKRK